MTIHFDGASERRKELVQALVEITGCEKKYLGAPSFDFRVGDYIIHKDASMDVNELLDEKELGLALHALRGRGFIPTGDTLLPHVDAPTKKEVKPCETTNDVDGITLSFPKNGLTEQNVDNLRKLIAAKSQLIKLALEINDLPIEEDDEKLSFPWLPETASSEMMGAAAVLLAALIKLAKKLKRVTLTQRETDNPRYAFRCFLLRLGFIGDKYKDARKRLMRGIPGNGSRRHFPAIEPAPETEPETPIEVVHYEKLENQHDEVTEEELDTLNAANSDDAALDNRA
ncbi:MAG: virulence [Clostridia bacterium]